MTEYEPLRDFRLKIITRNDETKIYQVQYRHKNPTVGQWSTDTEVSIYFCREEAMRRVEDLKKYDRNVWDSGRKRITYEEV